jgi:NADPH:quinone reductase-like Zn-dependent oxidoreductase
MHALMLGSHSSSPLTVLAKRADAEPGANQLWVRIEAAAFNPLDSKIAAGAMQDWFPIQFPYTPGTDFAGVVEKTGDGVVGFAAGDAVFGRSNPTDGGAIATHIIVSADLVALRPSTVSAATAACLPTPAGIALQGIKALGRSADAPFLVLGDGAVAQAAKAIGGSAATLVASVEQLKTAPKARYVFDAAGGALQQAALESLAPGAVIVAISAPVAPEVAARLGVEASFAVLETSASQLQELGRLAATGVLGPKPDRVIKLDEAAAAAFDRYVSREWSGKIIVMGESA